MAFTRFHDDPCRIIKQLQESTEQGSYYLNVPGNGTKPLFIEDPYVKINLWGGNLSNNMTNIESDLLGITRQLNRDNIKENNHLSYLNNNNYYVLNNYPNHKNEFTQQSRNTHPAWSFREIHSENRVNNFNYLYQYIYNHSP